MFLKHIFRCNNPRMANVMNRKSFHTLLCINIYNKYNLNLRQVRASEMLLKLTRRYMCTAKDSDKLYCPENMSKNLKSFFSESPLKNFEEKNEWLSSPYPEGNKNVAVSKNDERIDPETTSVFMFPGQGNQFVGMGKLLLEHPIVEDMFGTASYTLGYDLKKLCLNGPISKLSKTEYCQPATIVCSLAAIEEVKVRYPTALNNCIAALGYSVGEIAALIFAGSLTFEEGIKIASLRAKVMQKCSDAVQSGMMTVLIGPDSNLKTAMEDAKNHCKSKRNSDPVCSIASYLFAECRVIAGHEEALNFIDNNKEKYKIRKVSKLPVSGAFHTSLMEEAGLKLKEVLTRTHIKDPIIPVFSNVTGKPYKNEKDIQNLLPKQVYSAIKWEQILHFLYSRPAGHNFPQTYECGPGRSLSTIMKRVNSLAYKNVHHIKT